MYDYGTVDGEEGATVDGLGVKAIPRITDIAHVTFKNGPLVFSLKV